MSAMERGAVSFVHTFMERHTEKKKVCSSHAHIPTDLLLLFSGQRHFLSFQLAETRSSAQLKPKKKGALSVPVVPDVEFYFLCVRPMNGAPENGLKADCHRFRPFRDLFDRKINEKKNVTVAFCSIGSASGQYLENIRSVPAVHSSIRPHIRPLSFIRFSSRFIHSAGPYSAKYATQTLKYVNLT